MKKQRQIKIIQAQPAQSFPHELAMPDFAYKIKTMSNKNPCL